MNINIDFSVIKTADKTMTWDEAVQYAKDCGLKIPTRLESIVISVCKDELDFKLPESWWTSDEYSASEAWYAFEEGGTNYYAKYATDNVILIRRNIGVKGKEL